MAGKSRKGGKVAGIARKKLEKELGRSIVSKGNFLRKRENKKVLGG